MELHVEAFNPAVIDYVVRSLLQNAKQAQRDLTRDVWLDKGKWS